MIRPFVFVAVIGLATPALTQQAVQPGWIADARTNCRVWNQNPAANETITWSGPCEGGLAHGQGVLQWHENGKPGERYEGGMIAGNRHGYGNFVSGDGARYKGEWRENKRAGQGVQWWPSRNLYDGEWRDGKRHGRGIFVWADGNRYEGEWRDDARTGRGIFTWANGNRYEGEWLQNRAHGQGTLKRQTDTFAGVWSNGCFRQGDRKSFVGATPKDCGFE